MPLTRPGFGIRPIAKDSVLTMGNFMFNRAILLIMLVAAPTLASAAPLGTGFTYQGELQASGAPANGDFDFQFELFDVASGGTIVGSAVLIDNVTVNDGVFSIELDFGTSPFAGDQIWLEIGVRDGTSVGGYTGLLPRQKLTPAPYALHAEMVATNSVAASELADNAVDTGAIQNNAVTAAKIAANSVGSSEVDSSEVQLRLSCVTRTSAAQALDNFFTTITMSCEAGETPISGGWNRNGWTASNQCIPYFNMPTSTGWTVGWASATATECAGQAQRTIVVCCNF